jgi:hypothetical protein
MNSQDVVNASGLTYRQIDHAVRRGWLKPDNPHGKGTDNGREWAYTEYEITIIAGNLYRRGFRIDSAIKIARIRVEKAENSIYLGYGVTIQIETK